MSNQNRSRTSNSSYSVMPLRLHFRGAHHLNNNNRKSIIMNLWLSPGNKILSAMLDRSVPTTLLSLQISSNYEYCVSQEDGNAPYSAPTFCILHSATLPFAPYPRNSSVMQRSTAEMSLLASSGLGPSNQAAAYGRIDHKIPTGPAFKA